MYDASGLHAMPARVGQLFPDATRTFNLQFTQKCSRKVCYFYRVSHKGTDIEFNMTSCIHSYKDDLPTCRQSPIQVLRGLTLSKYIDQTVNTNALPLCVKLA